MRTIKIIIAGECGAGSTTVAKAVTDNLKTIFPESRIHCADDDDMPHIQADRIKAIQTDTMNCVIQTQQLRPTTPPNYEVDVKELLKGLPSDQTHYTVQQIQTAINLAKNCGIQDIHVLYISSVISWLKNWLEQPQKVDSLKAREIEAGDRQKREPGKRGRRGNFGLH